MVKAHVSTHELVAGRYRLLEVVHRETNRVCWYGEDLGAGRPRLLTQIGLPADLDGEGARRATARVIRMAETMGRVCPGQVAEVIDAVVEYGNLWVVTEWIDGVPLTELITQQGAFTYARAARIALEVLDVLEAAHGEGITHGELSPGQVFVRDQGAVVLTGFGLTGATLAPRITAPSYASPEQARDERIGPAADLWALGAMLYTMLEGRPPFRDRDRPEATLRGVDRLPLRSPVHAGPLAQTVQGLLRKNSRERLTRQVVREALTRVLNEDPQAALRALPKPRLRGLYQTGPVWSRRTMVAGTALAVVTVSVAVLAVTRQLPGTDSDSGSAASRPPASTPATEGQSSPPPSTPAPTKDTSAAPTPTKPTPTATPTRTPPPSPSPSPSGNALPAGFSVYRSPEGFSVALPAGWKALNTSRTGDLSYRVTFGKDDDPRTLAVTYSERVGPDPVAVWRDDVQPGLQQADIGFRRIGEIRATTYQGRKAADMEWLADDPHGTQSRTFGRGFLIGESRSFSLRWTTPAADWNDSANRQALDTFLRTFRPTSD
ncbi:serine/threonine-protein kinase [Streptomyces sp. NPDC006332]|uniref:serine/threonine protein kinase n=1 Tax=Streptomyces sp. NPDC006332 TaxID=3155456 RepID=UPI0033A39596